MQLCGQAVQSVTTRLHIFKFQILRSSFALSRPTRFYIIYESSGSTHSICTSVYLCKTKIVFWFNSASILHKMVVVRPLDNPSARRPKLVDLLLNNSVLISNPFYIAAYSKACGISPENLSSTRKISNNESLAFHFSNPILIHVMKYPIKHQATTSRNPSIIQSHSLFISSSWCHCFFLLQTTHFHFQCFKLSPLFNISLVCKTLVFSEFSFFYFLPQLEVRTHCLARCKGPTFYLTRQCVHVDSVFGLVILENPTYRSSYLLELLPTKSHPVCWGSNVYMDLGGVRNVWKKNPVYAMFWGVQVVSDAMIICISSSVGALLLVWKEKLTQKVTESCSPMCVEYSLVSLQKISRLVKTVNVLPFGDSVA
ncbi:hypothetical protein VP01_2985g3 [Puccinia sorghi]|uniref:Uncharacterized protein n=1 Tax=Puccinia sorghi TaxID=27349 RepID=A0A0L6V1B2_9BASI|nr:hypothetical protein VP01_2985g3 [Puccinia sorghi]